MITRLSDISNVRPPREHGISLEGYRVMYDRSEGIRSFILDYIPVNEIPNNLLNSALYLNTLVTCFELLCNSPEEYFEDYDTFLYDSIYEMVTNTGIVLPETLLNHLEVESTGHALANFHKYQVLYRFFNNKGKVYYSEQMKLLRLKGFNLLGNEISYTPYYLILEKEKVLRRAQFAELQEIMATKTKNELLEILSKYKDITRYKSLDKKQLIQKILDSTVPLPTEIFKAFFTLTDDYQAFKTWLHNEKPYFRLYVLMNNPIAQALRDCGSIMKDLIAIGDKSTASMLGDLYFEARQLVDFPAMAGDDLGEESVKRQLRKL